MFEDPYLWLTIGNVFLFISSFLMAWGIYKNRDMLRGYDLVGTTLTFLAVSCFTMFYTLQLQTVLVSFILNFPNWCMWLLATASVWKMKIDDAKKAKDSVNNQAMCCRLTMDVKKD